MVAYCSCRERAPARGCGRGWRKDPAERGKGGEMEKKYYFDETNLAIYCKQMT
jgi:hypothetical protein